MTDLPESDTAEVVKNLGDAALMLAGKTILMTGARGFLGRHFTDVFAYLNAHVLDRPVTVTGYDNLVTAGPTGSEMPSLPHMTFENRDVCKPLEWGGPVDYIVHLAGIASPFYYRAFPLETLEVAITGTRQMLELATRKHARFTYFSSSEIYGDPTESHVPTQESYRGNVSCRGPRSCYDESKRVGETLSYIFHEKFGTATSTIRPFNVYGPGMQEQDYRVMPNFANRIKAGLPLQIYGTGMQTRTFCYITDALTGFLLTMLRGVPGEAYNIGNPKPEVTMHDLIRSIETVLGRSVKVNVTEYPDSYPTDEPMRRCPDIRKARVQLGFQPHVDLEEGVRRFISWTDKVYTGQV